MAVKPVTNAHAPNLTDINRAEQVSFKNVKPRGNRSSTAIPGKDFTKNYAINLKDIDTAIINHVKNVMRIQVSEAGETVNVPVVYGNEERWVSARRHGFVRDDKGALLLPLIMTRRTAVAKDTVTQSAFKHDVKNELVTIARNSQWSRDNQYTRFAIDTGEKPAMESIVTGPADFVTVTYEIILWSAYTEQMNTMVEAFVDQNDTYWGDREDYKFLCMIDSFDDATEMAADTERFIKNTFTVNTKAYLLSEVIASVVTDKKFQAQRSITPRKVVFGFEGDATNYQVKK